VKKKRGTES